MSSLATAPSHTSPAGSHQALRDIAVVVSRLPADLTSLTVAASLARRYGAELDVVQVLPLPLPVADAWSFVADPACMEWYVELREQAARQSVELQRRLDSLGVAGHVRVVESFYDAPTGVAAAAARHADLSVIARPADAPADASRAHGYFSSLLLESGRPVLMVPSATEASTLPPRHVVIAWADTSEATRAVHDAMPLLQTAETVDIVMVDPVENAIENAATFGAALSAHLGRHGVTPRVIVDKSRGRPISRIILDRASRARAQLIVAGGYGHSRMREWVIGGTTRGLFLDSPIPVLFSH